MQNETDADHGEPDPNGRCSVVVPPGRLTMSIADVIGAAFVAFGIVFVAELGDKTQLLALGFGARYPFRIVALGLALGYAVANVLAVIVGGVLGAALPDRPIQIVSGIIFVVFAALAVRDALETGSPVDDVPVVDASLSTRRVLGSIAVAIAIAEMGDKTQITTATLASQSAPVGVFVGATLGAASSGMVGAVAGRWIGDRISARTIGFVSAGIFAAFAAVMFAGWF